MSVIHKKTTTGYFDLVASGMKTFDVRLADWSCQTGDTIVLDEIDDTGRLTGRSLRKIVGYVLRTKNFTAFPEDEVARYGYQVIALLDEAAA